jgi:hypothetical protein
VGSACIDRHRARLHVRAVAFAAHVHAGKRLSAGYSTAMLTMTPRPCVMSWPRIGILQLIISRARRLPQLVDSLSQFQAISDDRSGANLTCLGLGRMVIALLHAQSSRQYQALRSMATSVVNGSSIHVLDSAMARVQLSLGFSYRWGSAIV